MFLSVITPSYNYEQFIEDALNSVHWQCQEGVEHLILDDGSRDNSVAVARAHVSQPTVREQTNVGLAKTLNRLLDTATGEWVSWLNADDFYMKGAFQTVGALIKKYPDVDVVIGDTVFVDPEGHLKRLLPAHRMSGRVIAHYGAISAPNSIFFRRSVLQAVGFRDDTRILMDKWVLLDILRNHAKFRYLDTPLGAMRRHDGQLSAVLRHDSDNERTAFRRDAGVATEGRSLRASQAFGRGLHGWYKVIDGGFRNQVHWAQRQDEDMKWWPDPDRRD